MSTSTEKRTPEATGPIPVNWRVLIGAGVATLVITVWGYFWTDQFRETLGTVVTWASGWFGWFYVALAAVVLVFVVIVALSRHGETKLGPDHSQPEFSTMSWAAMLFAAGIGTDLMFFAVAEPVTQFMAPPSGEAESVEAAREATVWTLFHYGISGWGMYALMGMALGFFAFRLNLPLAVRSALSPIFGKRVDGHLGDGVDLAALLGTIFGVATTLGIGVVMVNVGLNTMFGVPVNTKAQLAVIVVGVIVATLSAVSGVDRGIKRLSELNVILAIGLTLWILVTGKTQYLLDALVLNIGDFFRLFPDMAMQTFAFEDTGTWMTDWTLFFWAWWIAWASFVGLFLARISRGRTIRQFVVGTLTIPFCYILMWISIYGNSALDLIRSGDREFAEQTMLSPEGGFYELLSRYPGFTFVAGLATLTGLLFYVTSADSAALVMANLSSRLPSPQHDGASWLRIFWAVATGALTSVMLLVGGIDALQSATVVMGLPFAFVMILVMVGLYRALQVEEMRRVSAAGSGGSTASHRRINQSWRQRLNRALAFPSPARAIEYEQNVILPTFADLVAEFESRGMSASAGEETEDGERFLRLLVGEGSEHPFVYEVWPRVVPVPQFGGRVLRGTDEYARLDVFLGDGSGQSYDVLGFTKDQFMDDVLDQYEKHLEFLHLQGNSRNGSH